MNLIIISFDGKPHLTCVNYSFNKLPNKNITNSRFNR